MILGALRQASRWWVPWHRWVVKFLGHVANVKRNSPLHHPQLRKAQQQLFLPCAGEEDGGLLVGGGAFHLYHFALAEAGVFHGYAFLDVLHGGHGGAGDRFHRLAGGGEALEVPLAGQGRGGCGRGALLEGGAGRGCGAGCKAVALGEGGPLADECGRFVPGRQLQVLLVDLLQEAAGLGALQVAPFEAAVGVAERAALFGAGNGHVEQAAFFLQLGAAGHVHHVGEEVLLHAHDVHVGEFKPLCAVDGHQAHPVAVVGVLLVGVGQQRHVDQEVGQGAQHLLPLGLHLGVGAGLGGGRMALRIAEFAHAVQQRLDVLIAAHALGRLVLEKVLQQARGARHVFAQDVRALRLQHGLETADHHHEVRHLLPQPFMQARLVQVLVHGRPNAYAVLVGGHHQLVHRALADAPGGVVDHALQRFLVVGVARQAEVGDQVLHLLALVEADAAVDAVGDVHFAQGLFHASALRVGAVQDGERLVGQSLVHFGAEDVVRHEAPFVVVADAAVDGDGRAFLVRGPNGLFQPVAVLFDQAVGRAHDVLGAAVVLLQLEDAVVRVVGLEVEDVLDVGPAEGVDALAVVAHHGDVPVARGQGAHDVVLGQVGVLVLIHQQVLEALLVLQHHLGMVAEEDVGEEQQVVEVHGAGTVAASGVLLVDGADVWAQVGGIGGHQLGVVQVVLGPHQVVLGNADAGMHLVGLVQLVVQLQFLHDGADQ